MGAWQSRYQTPTADALVAGLGPDARAIAEDALKRLGRKPKPVWVVPWNWTLWIESPERGPVLIVPDPARLLIAARVSRAFFEQHLAAQPAKGPRDPVANASCVGDAVWVEWVPESMASLDAVFRVIRPAGPADGARRRADRHSWMETPDPSDRSQSEPRGAEMTGHISRFRVFAGVLLVTASAALGGPLSNKISTLISRTDLGGATVAVHAIDLDTGAEVIAHNANLASIPASNMKIITSGAALSVLGTEFVFRTEIRVDSSVNPPRLILVGSGDPALGDPVLLERPEVGLTLVRLFDQIASALRAQGIDRISEIVVDDRVFDRDYVHSSWPTDQLNRWYCAELGGLNFFRNVVTIYTEPTSDNGTPITTLVPDAPWIELANRARTDTAGTNTAWVSRPNPSDAMTLLGKVRTRTEIQVSIHNPPLYAGRVIANELSRRGIGTPDRWAYDHVRLATETDKFPESKPVIVITTPLDDVLRRVNTDSHNLYAEALFKRIGHQVTGEPGSWSNGSAVTRMVISDALGHEMAESTNVADGSGMSRLNKVRPSTITAFMRWLSRDQARWDAFNASLAVPGEGTLRSRFGNTELSTQVAAKSGYLTGIYALSGVLTDPDSGRRVAFSILINHVPGAQARNARPLHEQIVSELDRWLVPNKAARPANLGG